MLGIMLSKRSRVASFFQELIGPGRQSFVYLSKRLLSAHFSPLYNSSSVEKTSEQKEETPQFIGLYLPKLELIKKLSEECLRVGNQNLKISKRLHDSLWSFEFIKFANLLDNYFLLKSSPEAKDLYELFSQIKSGENEYKNASESSLLQDFLDRFSSALERAGYIAIPAEKSEKILSSKSLDLSEIHLQANYNDYNIVNFWHQGRVEGNLAVWPLNQKMPKDWKTKKGYKSVVVLASHKSDGRLRLREFFNVPENQFKILMFDNLLDIPIERKVQVGSMRFVFGLGLLIQLVTFYGDFFAFAFMLMPLTFIVGVFTNLRIEGAFNMELGQAALEWKSKLVQRFIACDKVLINRILSNADDRAMKRLLLVYGASWILDKEGREISADSLNDFCREWLVNNSSKGADIPDDYCIDAAVAMDLLLQLKILYYEDDGSRLRVLPLAAASKFLLNQLVDDAVFLNTAKPANRSSQEKHLSG